MATDRIQATATGVSMTIVPIAILLVVLTALYVSAEFAAVSVRRSRIEQLAEEGNSFARRLAPVES